MFGALRRYLVAFLILLLYDVSGAVPPAGRRQLNLQEARLSGGYRLVLDKALNKLKQYLSAHHWPPLEEL